MIKLLLFDIGRVICDDDFPRLYADFGVRIGAKAEAVAEYNIQNIQDLIVGKIAPNDYWHFMQSAGNVTGETEIKKIWVEEGLRLATVNHELLGLVDELRKNYKVGIVSNLTASRQLIDEAQGIYPHFDFLILSHLVGIKKPDPKIFQLALDKAGVSADEAIFIDDHEGHTQSAATLGIHGIIFKDNQTLLKDLAAFEVRP